jgi:uncharacterized MAPEG superfamily protein
MTVRGEIAKPRRETGARSPENPRRTRAGRRGFEGRARRPKARRNGGSAIAAEVFMNHAGKQEKVKVEVKAGYDRLLAKP